MPEIANLDSLVELMRRQRAVRVHLSEGLRAPEIPDVVGKLERTAELALADARVDVATRSEIRSSQYGIGMVVAQDPPAARRGSGVSLLVNRGEGESRFVMPDLINRDYGTVRRFFERQGFRFGSVKYEPYEGATPGAVLRQHPLPGHPLRKRDVISLVVAGGGSGVRG